MTGRDRSKEEPFFATGLDKMPDGIQRAVRGIHGVIQRSPKVSPYAWVGSGYRPEPDNKQNEHRHGLAVDLIVTADTGMIPTEDELLAGNILLNWLTDHGDDLKIHGIVFSRDSKMRPEFWGYSHPGTWKEGEHREGKDEGEEISANHVDHIHVLFESNADWPSLLDDSVADRIKPGLPTSPGKFKPGLPNVGANLQLVDSVSISHLREARYSDPEKDGTPVGPYGNEVFTLETALARTQWLRWQYVDGHYGTSTVGDGSSGYGGTTGFQHKHTGTSAPDGWLGRQELTKLFQLAGMSVEVTD